MRFGRVVTIDRASRRGSVADDQTHAMTRFLFKDGRRFKLDEVGRVDFGNELVGVTPELDERIAYIGETEGNHIGVTKWGYEEDFNHLGGNKARLITCPQEATSKYLRKVRGGERLRVRFDRPCLIQVVGDQIYWPETEGTLRSTVGGVVLDASHDIVYEHGSGRVASPDGGMVQEFAIKIQSVEHVAHLINVLSRTASEVFLLE